MCESSLILRVVGQGGGWGGGLERADPGMRWELHRHVCRSGFLQFTLRHPRRQRSAVCVVLCSVSVVVVGYPGRRYQLVPAHEPAQKQNQHRNVPEGCSFS